MYGLSTGGMWAMTDHDDTGVPTLSGTQLEHSTRASSTTERESISITLADIACVVAVQQQPR